MVDRICLRLSCAAIVGRTILYVLMLKGIWSASRLASSRAAARRLPPAAGSGMGEFKVPEAMVSILCIDLVKIATKVRCAATGDFIWFGYQPWGREVGKRNNYVASIGIRNEGIMLTKKAARSINAFCSECSSGQATLTCCLRIGAATVMGSLAVVAAS